MMGRWDTQASALPHQGDRLVPSVGDAGRRVPRGAASRQMCRSRDCVRDVRDPESTGDGLGCGDEHDSIRDTGADGRLAVSRIVGAMSGRARDRDAIRDVLRGGGGGENVGL